MWGWMNRFLLWIPAAIFSDIVDPNDTEGNIAYSAFARIVLTAIGAHGRMLRSGQRGWLIYRELQSAHKNVSAFEVGDFPNKI